MGDTVPATNEKRHRDKRHEGQPEQGDPIRESKLALGSQGSSKDGPLSVGRGSVEESRKSPGETEAVRGIQAETQLDTAPACPKDVREGGGLARAKENRVMPRRACEGPRLSWG